jgi:hypothetical protein
LAARRDLRLALRRVELTDRVRERLSHLHIVVDALGEILEDLLRRIGRRFGLLLLTPGDHHEDACAD